MPTKICPVCDTENSLGAKNCELCGEPLPAPATSPKPAAVLAPPQAPATSSPPASAATAKRTPVVALVDASDLLGEGLDEPTAPRPQTPPPATTPPPTTTTTTTTTTPAAVAVPSAQATSGFNLEDLDDLDGLDAPPAPASPTTPTKSEADRQRELEAFEAMLSAELDGASTPETPAPAPAPAPVAPTPVAITPTPAPVAPAPAPVAITPAPAPTPKAAPAANAALVVYMNRQPAHRHEVVNDETLIGRSDPTTNTFPDLDLTPFDASQVISRRHVQILREGGHFYVQPLSAGGTQVGSRLLNLGDRAELKGGEVLILGAKVALKFERAQQEAPVVVEKKRARLTVYMNRQPAHQHEIVNDETLIGRSDPTSNTFPDLDLTPFDASQVISRRHVQILREGGHFYVQPLSAGGTQVGNQLLSLGDRTALKGGEVLILGAKVALKFDFI